MKFDFKQYEIQDITCKGPMRRRYNNWVEKYKGYIIYNYIRGKYTRYSAEDEKENIFVETDNLEEVKKFIDENLSKKE